jgi:hypothetical protein
VADKSVLIACKAPNGLVLNLDRYEAAGANGAVQRVGGGASVTLKGWSRPFNMPDMTEGGYALTAVPEDFWAAWIATHADSSLLADKILLPPHKDAAVQALDHAAVPQMFRPAQEGDVPNVKAERAAA